MRERFVFASDFHAPNHLPQAVALVCAFLKDYKPSRVILGGDIVDFSVASSFIRLNLPAGPQTVREEAEIAVREVIEPIRKAAPHARMDYLEGNHEIRVLRMLASVKAGLEGIVELSDFLGCRKLGITYHASKGGNAWFEWGGVVFMHGDRYGINPARLTLEEWRCPVVFGHAHKESFDRRRSPNQRTDTKAWGAGCLMATPDYTDKDPWHRGFIAGWVDEETGEYDAEHISLSGPEFTELYSAYGKYHAVRVWKDGRKSWIVRSFSDTPKPGHSRKGRKTVEHEARGASRAKA